MAEDIHIQAPDEARRMLELGETAIDQIPDQLDRADRLRALAEAYSHVGSPMGIEHFVKRAFSAALELGDTPTADAWALRVLELAHATNPELASSLTPLIDDKLRRYSLEERVSAQALRRQPRELTAKEASRYTLNAIAGAAVLLRRSLASGRGTVQHDAVVQKWLELIGTGDFGQVAPVVSWAVDNARMGLRSATTAEHLYQGLVEAASFLWQLGEVIVAPESRAQEEQTRLVALPEHIRVLRAGSGEAAITDVREWVQANAAEYLTICDPYFTITELALLQSVPPGVRVWILTSLRQQRGLRDDKTPRARDLPAVYDAAWRQVSDLEPPPTQVTVLGTKSGKSPIHSRYLLTRGAGLRLSTSTNSLGRTDTEMNPLTASEAQAIEQQMVRPWQSTQVSMFEGERLVNTTLSLGIDSY